VLALTIVTALGGSFGKEIMAIGIALTPNVVALSPRSRCGHLKGMPGRIASGIALALCGAACNPLVSVEGSFFPAWMLCLVVGVVLSVAARSLFVLLGLEPDLGPPTLIYPSLTLLVSVLTLCRERS
jgi:hypothetical protein